MSSNLIINWNVFIFWKKRLDNWLILIVNLDEIMVKRLWVVNMLWKFLLSIVYFFIGVIYFIVLSMFLD